MIRAKLMYSKIIPLCAVCLLLLLFSSVVVYVAEDAQEEQVELSEVPASVRTTIFEHAKENQIKTIEIDREDGTAVYDVEVEVNGEIKEFSVSPDGKFLGFEEEDDAENGEDSDGEEVFVSDFGVDKGELISHGRNPYFVLEPGYQIILAGGDEQVVMTVLYDTKIVDGVETRVLEERETKKGELVEVSRNYFAIGKRTNSVYYFGEDVDIFKEGKVVKHEGGWLSGKNGAKFGLMMPGHIQLDDKFYQEYAPGEAMDRAEIESLNETVTTPAGVFHGCIKMEETTPLEPGEKDYKLYAPGIGMIQDESLKLVRWSEMKEE